jgi:DNA-binding NtrC family response regulator
MAKLIVVEGPDNGSEFPLPDEQGAVLSVGRDARNKVPLSDGSVSREHLRIEFTGRGYRLIDLGSKNRTFLNGEPVREGLLKSGDRIGLGDSELRFEDDRALLDEPGMESTIMKELPAAGGAALEGIVEALSRPAGPREEGLRQALQKVRQILSLSQAISRSGTLEELYQELLGVLVPALEASRGVVLTLSEGRWVSRAARSGLGGEGPAGEPVGVSESILRHVAQEGKAVLSAQTRRDERFQKKASIIEGAIVSALAAPIFAAESRPPPATHSPLGQEEEAGGTTPAPQERPRTQASGRRRVVGVLYADRRGAERPFGEPELALLTAAALEAGDIAGRLEEEGRLREQNRNLLRSISETKKIVGRSRAVSAVLDFIRRAAPAPQTILIRGETGTGKELVASAIHYQSNRQGKPFVAINCAAIPDTLIESELFGHERGAFTGAVARRKGRFELADGGTVFLDEVAELSAGCQAKLLRLLEDRRFERLGGTQTVEADVRLIAATNKDLAREIGAGRFREDLFYRLNVLGLILPPLRERREDIPLLAAHFLLAGGAGSRTLAPDALEKLQAYGWPGNIRQLKNVIESALVLGDGPTIRASDLILPTSEPKEAAPGAGWEPLTLEELQRRHILRVLEHTGGNKKRASDILGIERCTLYAKLKSIGVPLKQGAADEGRKEGQPDGKEPA